MKIADYVGYCPVQFEFKFTRGNGGSGVLYTATLAIQDDGVIWGMCPSDGTAGNPGDAFRITTSDDPSDSAPQPIPLTALSIGKISSAKTLQVNYNPSLDTQGNGGTFYFYAYLWCDKNAILTPTTNFFPMTSANATIIWSDSPLTDGQPTPIDTAWTKNAGT
jgi:hypothetical protein